MHLTFNMWCPSKVDGQGLYISEENSWSFHFIGTWYYNLSQTELVLLASKSITHSRDTCVFEIDEIFNFQ